MISLLPKFRESLRADAWLLAWPTSVLALLAIFAPAGPKRPLEALHWALLQLEAPSAWVSETSSWVDRHALLVGLAGLALIALCLGLLLQEDVSPLDTRATSGALLGTILVWQRGSWGQLAVALIAMVVVAFARARIRGGYGMVITGLLVAVFYAPLQIWSWFGEPFTARFDRTDSGAGDVMVAEGAKRLRRP